MLLDNNNITLGSCNNDTIRGTWRDTPGCLNFVVYEFLKTVDEWNWKSIFHFANASHKKGLTTAAYSIINKNHEFHRLSILLLWYVVQFLRLFYADVMYYQASPEKSNDIPKYEFWETQNHMGILGFLVSRWD